MGIRVGVKIRKLRAPLYRNDFSLCKYFLIFQLAGPFLNRFLSLMASIVCNREILAFLLHIATYIALYFLFILPYWLHTLYKESSTLIVIIMNSQLDLVVLIPLH